MPFFEHSLLKPETIEERAYQKTILNTAINRNTLVVLPTGTGKTALAILLTANRLEKFPESRVLVMAPTRPLCAQHQREFQKTLNLPEEDIILVTGQIAPSARGRLYRSARVIVATPQTIENDIGDVLDLSDFSLIVIDECHRSVKHYAYPAVARAYLKSSKFPRVLGLTASPGSNEPKIKEICSSLAIDAVEIRAETDSDISPYMEEIKTEWVKVELPPAMRLAVEQLKTALKERLDKLNKYNLHIMNKRDLLLAQQRISKQISAGGEPVLYHMAATAAEALKLWHAQELLETQSLAAVASYIEKLGEDTSKSAKRLLLDAKIGQAFAAVQSLVEQGAEHPKMARLAETISKAIIDNPDVKIIVFSHYRDNIDRIAAVLKRIPDCKPAVLIGQGKGGLKQKEQIDIIRDYNVDVYNCLITSPVGEEGLHIPSADLAIFYEPVPSEIRTIQRRGRVGRTKVGRVVVMLTKNTRDEAYFWTARSKEKKMRTILHDMKEEMNDKRGLKNFVE